MAVLIGVGSPARTVTTDLAAGQSLKVKKCATDFEALLVAQILRSARQAGGGGLTSDGNDDSEANSTLLEFGEQQFAQVLANSGTLGIGKMVIAGLKNNAD